jgi:sensor histidine kinase YesM
VRNTGAPFGARTASGFGLGLENVKRRLHHYYGQDASLTITRDDEGATLAELRLPPPDADEQDVETVARTAIS